MSPSLRHRVLVLVALTAFLVCLPQLASARFSGQQQASLSVGTAAMVAPTGVTGTFDCDRSGIIFARDALTVSVSGFTDNGPAGATYTYVLTRTGEERSRTSTTSRTASLVSERAFSTASTMTYQLTISASLHAWTGPVYQRTIQCAGDENGSL